MALVIFAGYVIFGVTGFGASPITIPVLVHVLPITFVLPLAALLDLSSGLALGFHTRRQADTRELVMLVPFTLVGLALGVTLLVRLPRDATLLALGLFVCAHAIHVMLRRKTARRLARWWAAPAGLVSGVVGALFGMGGPPYVAYITGRIPDAAAQRATISQMVILNVGGLGRRVGRQSRARARRPRDDGAYHRRGSLAHRRQPDRADALGESARRRVAYPSVFRLTASAGWVGLRRQPSASAGPAARMALPVRDQRGRIKNHLSSGDRSSRTLRESAETRV